MFLQLVFSYLNINTICRPGLMANSKAVIKRPGIKSISKARIVTFSSAANGPINMCYLYKIHKTTRSFFLMRIIKISLAFALLFTFSCQSWKKQDDVRTTASTQSEEEIAPENVQTFERLMANPDDSEKSRNFAKFLDRQKNFFDAGEQLMFEFDEKLDVLYKKTQKGEQLADGDTDELEKTRFQNYIAWEFSDRNLHEMLDLYSLALKHANTEGSPYQKSCKWIIPNVKKWVDEAWKKGDKSAVITLASHLNDVNVKFQAEQVNAITPSFKAYINPSQAMLTEAYNRSKWLVNNRPKTHLDSLIEKRWSEDFTNRQKDFEDFRIQQKDLKDTLINPRNDFRTPQALDVLEPSADGKGTVTGNRFPPGKWAMTFDDGPHPTYTQGMVNNLKNNGIHGTFFWQTQNVVQYTTFPKQKSDLYSRACHSYTHANLPKLGAVGLDKEINQAVNDFAKVVGEKPTLYRCPYGACGSNGSVIRQMIAKQNMLQISWNVDTLDWQDKNPDSIFDRTKKQIDTLGRGIILFHDVHPQSIVASDKVIKYLKTKYTIAPLNKLIEESRGKPYYTP
ncbi:hypothetical protein CIK05_05795 [Bdellovibrio sp. qaytius]|nr:hypothetical protein CIK05_05795 [Bdellovibrio sp. qaytius]